MPSSWPRAASATAWRSPLRSNRMKHRHRWRRPTRRFWLRSNSTRCPLRCAPNLQPGELEHRTRRRFALRGTAAGSERTAAAAGRPARRRQDPDSGPAGDPAGAGGRRADGDHRRRQACRSHRAACRLHQAAWRQPDRRLSSRHAWPRAPHRQHAAPVLIDTPGCDPFDPAQLEELTALATTIDAAVVLVLPGGLDPAEAADLAVAYAAAGASLLVATRLDLARRLGGILAASAGARLAH